MKFIAAIDQGTTSTRCIIFDHSGNPISNVQKEHKQIYPRPGWVEHDPLEILSNAHLVFEKAISETKIGAKQIEAIGITNQRETTVLWDSETGLPYSNVLVWQDTRTDKLCASMAHEGLDEKIRKITGLPIATYFSGLKIKWLIENTPEIQKSLKNNSLLFGNIDTWLIWNFTGGINGGKHVTDVTNASRTMLMNLETLNWDEEILGILNIPKEILPDIKPSSSIFGEFIHDGIEIPIAGVLGDQQAALFRQLCFEPGDAKNTYGTGCFLLMNTGTRIIRSSNGLISTVGYKLGDDDPVYCLEGSIAITGALIQWLRDNLHIINNLNEVEALAASVPDNGGVFFVPAFSGLFAPYWHSNARGIVIGLTIHSTDAHIARAALEATAFQTREVLEAIVQDSSTPFNLLKVDGGMVKNNLLMQFQSDILNIEVIRTKVTETTALEAAYAAGLATGYWKDKEELISNWEKDKSWNPIMPGAQREEILSRWKLAVNRSMNWIG